MPENADIGTVTSLTGTIQEVSENDSSNLPTFSAYRIATKKRNSHVTYSNIVSTVHSPTDVLMLPMSTNSLANLFAIIRLGFYLLPQNHTRKRWKRLH